ncbi:glycosyltransferase family 4 protein [Cellulomonas sp. JH27-2]|uniref:glycosyltransferase family 4 protein n=1 Tax=Cellulomonas sp. JH27-2 TaxID=2774139 RepID=UPI00177E81A2|nr:glycosyltransferase family 4 protein [Cellulomonas sp. JH27-2]MBD8059618.1 glycosyltransferase family 4 protein [Cellulomonas sp. JH27-2]
MTDAPEAHVTVAFGSRIDTVGWRDRHARGEVPDAWPYGLDKLARFCDRLDSVSLPEPSRTQLAASRVGRFARRRAVASAARRIGVAWDEHVARRMLTLAPRPEMYTGAIWFTDAFSRDRHDPVVASQTRVLRAMDGVYVNSRAQVAVLADALGPSGPPAHHFPFGIDADFFTPAAYPERPLVVSFGGDRDRDPGTLYEALRMVHEAVPAVEIIVQSRSEAPTPPGVVKVPTMPHSELRALYRRASVVMVATRPNLHMSGLTVSLEAMATARPVVLTATPGVDDYFVDGENAMLARVGDADDVARRALALLADPDAAQAMGGRARQEVERRFTTTHLATAMAASFGLPTTTPVPG